MGVGEAALFLHVRRGRQEEDLRFYPGRIGARPLPIGCRLDLVEVAHHHPVQVFQGGAVEAGIDATSRRILTHREVALHFVILHGNKHGQVRVVLNDFG